MWPFGKKKPVEQESYTPSPQQLRHRNFIAAEESRLFSGWTTHSASINQYLERNLTALRARSREQARNNPLARRYVSLMKTHIVGANGVSIQARTLRNGELDTPANDAIEAAFSDWANNHADYDGNLSFAEIQSLAIGSAATDGEFVVQMHDTGPYGIQLRVLDAERLDVTKNRQEANGNITRLGIERRNGRPVRYYFKDTDSSGNYVGSRHLSVPARRILHGFLCEWVDQYRGVPWMYASLHRLKMLDGYDEAAITAARAGAAKMGFFQEDGGGEYVGDETDENGNIISDMEAGTLERLPPGVQFNAFDPNYPHEQYTPFTKKALRDVGAGWDLSYPTLSGDLEGANYSSIRWGGLDEREMFKARQQWFIRSFVRPVYEEFIRNSVLRGAIQIGTRPLRRPIQEYKLAHYQGKRWPWVDPEKDMKAHGEAIDRQIRSESSIIREMGEDPETVWRQIRRDRDMKAQLGISEVTNDDQSENTAD